MANTRRSKADILQLFADNTTEQISPQDARDYIVTALGGYASIYTTDASTAQTGINATPALVTGWTSNGQGDGLVPDATTDRITVDIDGTYVINCNISFSGSLSRTFEVHLYINGVVAPEGFHRKMGTGGDVGSASFAGIKIVTAAQYLQVYVSSPDGGTSMTMVDAQFTVHQIA